MRDRVGNEYPVNGYCIPTSVLCGTRITPQLRALATIIERHRRQIVVARGQQSDRSRPKWCAGQYDAGEGGKITLNEVKYVEFLVSDDLPGGCG
jgi:hypothetical protein